MTCRNFWQFLVSAGSRFESGSASSNFRMTSSFCSFSLKKLFQMTSPLGSGFNLIQPPHEYWYKSSHGSTDVSILLIMAEAAWMQAGVRQYLSCSEKFIF